MIKPLGYISVSLLCFFLLYVREIAYEGYTPYLLPKRQSTGAFFDVDHVVLSGSELVRGKCDEASMGPQDQPLTHGKCESGESIDFRAFGTTPIIYMWSCRGEGSTGENPRCGATYMPLDSISQEVTSVTHRVPHGTSSIEFYLALDHDVITAAYATPEATHPYSRSLQESFARVLPDAVIGKKIGELDLHALGGASLTTLAFMQFIRSDYPEYFPRTGSGGQ